MDPAKPPFPTPWNLPFQPEAGSHTSTWISESADGFKTIATRQNSTATWTGFSPTVTEPAATDCAIVMAVFGSWSELMLAQVAADNEWGSNANDASNGTDRRVLD